MSVALSALNDDASRCRIEQHVTKPDGTPAATIRLDASWFSLKQRKLVTLPDELAQMPAAPRTETFHAPEPTREHPRTQERSALTPNTDTARDVTCSSALRLSDTQFGDVHGCVAYALTDVELGV